MTTLHILPEGTVTSVYTTEAIGVGTQYTDSSNKRYVFCYNAGADSTAQGDTLGLFLTTPAWGHISVTAATSQVITVNAVVLTAVSGIALSTIATTEYGWIQVGGYAENVTTAGALATGNAVICADNAKIATLADETMFHGVFGFAPADDSSNDATLFLNGCHLDF